MGKKLGLSFLLAVLIQTLIYGQWGTGSFWNGTFFLIFLLIYLLLNHWSSRFRKPSNKKTPKEGKIVDLEQFRKKREEQNRPKKQEPSELNQWTPLFVSNDPSKMELVHSLLTSYNIECHISNRHVTSLYPSIEGLDMILQVASEDQQRCIEILKKHELQPGGI